MCAMVAYPTDHASVHVVDFLIHVKEIKVQQNVMRVMYQPEKFSVHLFKHSDINIKKKMLGY